MTLGAGSSGCRPSRSRTRSCRSCASRSTTGPSPGIGARAGLARRASGRRADRGLDRRLAAVRERLGARRVERGGRRRRRRRRGIELRSGLDRAAYEAGVGTIRDSIARGRDLPGEPDATARGPLPWRSMAAVPPPANRRSGPVRGLPRPRPQPAERRAAGDPLGLARAIPRRSTPDGDVATNPIKGTRPRGRDRDDDRRLARELLSSAKDRAENVMIVDVLRNDLGRVCRPGSVRVPRLCRLERTAAVQHLVQHRDRPPRLRPGRVRPSRGIVPRRLDHRRTQDPRNAVARTPRAGPARPVHGDRRLAGPRRRHGARAS